MGFINLSKQAKNGVLSDAEDDLMANFNVIKNELNGSVDTTNIADSSVTTAKLAEDISMTKIKTYDVMMSAYTTAAQSFAAATSAVLLFDNKVYDFGSAYNILTGRYTPQTEGRYLVSWMLVWDADAAADDRTRAIMQKNGSAYVNAEADAASNQQVAIGQSAIVYLNGSTDYVRIVCDSVSARDVVAGAYFNVKLIGYN